MKSDEGLFWKSRSSLWEVICHKKVQHSSLNQSLDFPNQQLIVCRLNYKWLSFPPNQTSLDRKASKLFTQIRVLGSLFVTTMFASRVGSWNWGAMNHVLTFKRQTLRKLRYLSVRHATKFNLKQSYLTLFWNLKIYLHRERHCFSKQDILRQKSLRLNVSRPLFFIALFNFHVTAIKFLTLVLVLLVNF